MGRINGANHLKRAAPLFQEQELIKVFTNLDMNTDFKIDKENSIEESSERFSQMWEGTRKNMGSRSVNPSVLQCQGELCGEHT